MVVLFPALFVGLVFGLTYLTNMFPMRYMDIQMFIPAFSALLCLILGRERIMPLFKFGSVKDILLGLFIPIFALLIVMGVSWLFSFGTYGWSSAVLRRAGNSHLSVFKDMFLFVWPLIFLKACAFAMGEEMGWRGYLADKFQRFQIGFWGRALTVGIVFTLWHLPALFKAGASNLKMGIYAANLMLLSLMLTWLYERSQAIWGCVLLYAGHSFLFTTFLKQYTIVKTGPVWLHGQEGAFLTLAYGLIILILAYRKEI